MSGITSKNYNKQDLQAKDLAHHMPAQADYGHILKRGGSTVITNAKGCYFYDIDGKEYLDGMAGLWCVALGYGRKELAEAAYNQMLELPYYNSFFKTATAPAIELAAKIAQLCGGELQHVFFNTSGSEAIDTMYRGICRYWSLVGQPQRKIFIARENGYHGSTVLGAALGGMKALHEMDNAPVSGIAHIMQPYKFNLGFDESEEEFCNRSAQALENKILELGAENVAAFVGEPIQGAGGVIIPPENYWQRIEAICRKYGILLVCDEVICGYGRTGEWFAHQAFDISPDVITTAKQLSSGYAPISATIFSNEIFEVLRDKGEDFVHGYTYSGHPVSAAVALKNLEILEGEGIIENVRNETAPYFKECLKSLNDLEMVGETRSFGLLGAIEIVSEKGTNHRFGGKEGKAGIIVRDNCLKNGLMVRAVRDSIVICPPLIITKSEIVKLVGLLKQSLEESRDELAKI